MKKVLFILGFTLWGGCLWAQDIPDCDYNPYRYEEWKNGVAQAYKEIREEFLKEPCDLKALEEYIEGYNETQDIQFLYSINGNCNCFEVIDYAKSLIDTSPNEDVRCLAIGMLGFRRQYEYIPSLLKHLEKDISPTEKIAIASTLGVLGEISKAFEIFEQYCYAMEDMNYSCQYYYFHIFDKQAAIKYFDYYFNKPETQLEAACSLAKLGVYDKTFPLFVKFLKDNTIYERETDYSLVGLAAIGTTEAFEIIKQQTKNSTDGLIARTATNILNRIINERRAKCKE